MVNDDSPGSFQPAFPLSGAWPSSTDERPSSRCKSGITAHLTLGPTGQKCCTISSHLTLWRHHFGTSGTTVFTIILCQGLGSGMTQTLLTQLNQLMCSRNYSINQSTWTAIINILVGFLGAFSINYFAKKHKLQEETAKIGFALACISTIIMMMALNTYENLWVIMLGFAGFGFFGYAAYPMSLELAVEESYPTDASISEAFMHIGK